MTAGVRVRLAAPGVEAILEPALGGRIAALRVDGLDVILAEGHGPLAWGCYPMVPWAGRLRDGRLEWAGEVHELPRTMPPHAIHGTTWYAPWTCDAAGGRSAQMSIELGRPWPFGGTAVHRVELTASELVATLEVRSASVPMPVVVGWHPWFPRRLPGGGRVELDLHAGGMLVRGPDGLPTGEIRPPTAGPWDDTFVDLASPPVVRWPGAVELDIASDVAWWTIYTERAEGICVEPQTGPPNGLATGQHTVVRPGEPLVATMSLAWRRLA